MDKLACFMGNLNFSTGPFSAAMLNYQRVNSHGMFTTYQLVQNFAIIHRIRITGMMFFLG